MSKKEEKESGPIMGVTINDICQTILVNEVGEVIMHREEEMLARIAKMEGQVKSWVDGLLDLNEKYRRFNAQLDLEINRVTNLERRVKELPKVLNEELSPLVEKLGKLMEFVDLKDGVRKKEAAELGGRIAVVEERVREINVMLGEGADCEKESKKGGWDDGGTKQDP